MKKLLIVTLIFLTLFSKLNAQILEKDRIVFETPSTVNKLWLPYNFYKGVIDPDGDSLNNYFFWSNVLFFQDTLRHLVTVSTGHGFPSGNNGLFPLTKVIKGDTLDFNYYETKHSTSFIPLNARSLAYNLIGDTIVGMKHDIAIGMILLCF